MATCDWDIGTVGRFLVGRYEFCPFTCSPLAGLHINHSCPVLLGKVLQQDHVVLLVGVVNEH